MTDEATYRLTDARIGVSTPHSSKRSPRQERMWRHLSKHKDWETFCRLMKTLEAAGFTVGHDPRISEQYPILAGDHRYGWKATPQGRLEFKAQIYNTGCDIQFFQSVVTTNKNGGEYDFDREAKMPYLVRKLYEGTRAKLIAHLESRGFQSDGYDERRPTVSSLARRLGVIDGTADRVTAAEVSAAALAGFNSTWDGEYEKRRGIHRFDRDETGWPSERELKSWDRTDHDGARIEQGQVRFFRDHQGFLKRGVVFGGINGMWIVVYGPGRSDRTHLHAKQLFSWRAGLERKVHPRPRTLESILKAAIERQDFERAIVLRDLIARQSQDRKAAA